MTGPSTPYDKRAEQHLFTALTEAFADEAPEGVGDLFVSGEIEWAGDYNATAERTTRLQDLDLGKLAAPLQKAREDRANEKPLASYDAKGWRAKVIQLSETKHGRGLLATVASPKTLMRWLSDEESPIRPDKQRAVEKMYEDVRMGPVTRAQESRGVLASVFSAILGDKYGAEIRIFGAHDFHKP